MSKESTVQLDLVTMKTVYRQAVDPRAPDAEGDAWWSEVAVEVQSILNAPGVAAAARIIAWWHHDWSATGDTAACAAHRIRTATARLHRTH